MQRQLRRLGWVRSCGAVLLTMVTPMAITPNATTAMAVGVISGQMLADLIVLGLGIKVILTAVSHGQQQQPGDATNAPSGE
jgi:cytochrome c oxidase assembly factor CtaG